MLEQDHKDKLRKLAHKLIDQEAARIIVPAQQKSTGFWFGGGNMIECNGALYLVGRYRNFGDSRTGVGLGQRGLELAIFCSKNKGQSWEKIISLAKSDLDLPGKPVLSIEGAALHPHGDEVELFISTEKDYNPLPASLRAFQKAGTGNWSIERLAAPTVEALRPTAMETVLETDDPRYIHTKDPFVYDCANGDLALLFCIHPFSWSSSGTAYFMRKAGTSSFCPGSWDFIGRSNTWDVAMRRGTALFRVPQLGVFAGKNLALFFYDGGESLRNMDEHSSAVKRPRGYSCEELGGLGFIADDNLESFETLSLYLPEFLSPWGTACSRYVDVYSNQDGVYATWQQSQPDLSQPLVMNFVPWDDIHEIII